MNKEAIILYNKRLLHFLHVSCNIPLIYLKNERYVLHNYYLLSTNKDFSQKLMMWVNVIILNI